MRRFILLPILAVLMLGACSDIAGLGGSVDGDWRATIGGEDVRVSLRDDGGDIWGNGYWGYDKVYVFGSRSGSGVSLRFEFDGYNPIDLDGTVRRGLIDGRLYGSGYNGDYARFDRY